MRVLCVVAHPDDEVLGCGATLARHVLAGDEARVVILSTGATSRPEVVASDVIGLREAAMAAARIIGATVSVGTMPDNRLDSVDLLDVVQTVEMALDRFSPEVVYTHAATDLNVDHRLTHQAVVTACRPVPECSVKRLLAFEVPSSTEWGTGFQPNVFVGMSEEALDRKMKALECYAAEMRPYPHARSREAVEALARVRGVQAGVPVAEAFVLVREIV